MDFGIFVPFHRMDESGSTHALYREALEQVTLAEAAGISIAWFPEHHLVHYYSCPSPLMFAVRAAAATHRIRLGTAILVIPYYNPLRLAGELGMADVLTDGRLEIGVGRGAFEYEFDRFGIDERIGAARLREGMDILHGLLTQEDFAYAGETMRFGPATAVPKAIQRPHPPIWVAARSPETIKWAVQHGYNLLATPWREPFARVELLHGNVRKIVDEVRPATRPRFAVSRMTFVAATREAALDGMRPIQTSHRIFTKLFRNQATVKGGFTKVEPVDDEFTAEQLLDNLVAGTPDVVVEKLKQYEALGVDHFIIYGSVGNDHATTMKSLSLFAERVMPHFRQGGRP